MTQTSERTGIDRVLHERALSTVFQPIVHLDTGAVVAHEALTRGPAGALASPEDLVAAARREGLLAELDLTCWSAVVGALAGGPAWQDVRPTVFVNAEPEGLGDLEWRRVEDLARAAAPHAHLVLEVTERAIEAHQGHLLRTVARVRELGWGIALDDVGVSPASLAFMPVLDPDVVKLDVDLVQRSPDGELARTVHAVGDYAERRGCAVLAEGIETPRHLDVARSLGARWGQGWRFGRPDPVRVPEGRVEGAAVAPRARTAGAARDVRDRVPTPLQALGDVGLRRGRKDLLVQLSRRLEEQAAGLGGTCLLVTSFEDAASLTAATRRRYEDVATGTGFVYALVAGGRDADPVPGVRVVALPEDDDLAGEWYVAVLGPHFHAALVAREVRGGPVVADGDRPFDHTVTYRHDHVVATVRLLLERAGVDLPGDVAP